ncbi:MAG TPA: response regulator [Vicinamibacterales bacterium]|jgi:CheY-like chemotaxis protein|nr:response regulator [Vicinamibacterales bacterium]
MPAPVVIVDSNRDGLEMYVTALALEGIQAEAATSAREALDVIAKTQPRAIVTELRLPGTRGAELVKSVRTAQPHAYIVGLSTSGPREVREAHDAGCDLVLPLPCLPETLLKHLQHALL